MNHERVFNIALASISAPVVGGIAATYYYDFSRTGGKYTSI